MVSNEQARAELAEQVLCSPKPEFAQLRKELEFLLPSERERVCCALVNFMTSDAVLDNAIRRAGIDPFELVQEEGPVTVILRKTDQPNVISVEIPGLPASVKLVIKSATETMHD